MHNETCLHVLCQGPQILLLSEGALSPRLARPQRDEQRRAECLQVRALAKTQNKHAIKNERVLVPVLRRQMILSWTGARLEGGQYEKANVNATDNHNSTCMHAAAAAGMKICVEVRGSQRGATTTTPPLTPRFRRLIFGQIGRPQSFQRRRSDAVGPALASRSVCFVFDYCQIRAERRSCCSESFRCPFESGRKCRLQVFFLSSPPPPLSSLPPQLLIQSEADLFVEDEEKLTPCDHAERHHHTELALSLESQMVFSSSSCRQSNADTHSESTLLQYKEVRAQLHDRGEGGEFLLTHLGCLVVVLLQGNSSK